MSIEEIILNAIDLPEATPTDQLDARDLPPPHPLRDTLERLPELPEGTVLIQLNNRAPQHLYPRLDDRGYEYETFELEGDVVTAIWKE